MKKTSSMTGFGVDWKDFIGDDCSLTEYNMSSSYTYICRLGLKGISAVGIKLVWTEEGFIENSREHKDVIHHSCHRTASCPAARTVIPTALLHQFPRLLGETDP